MAKRELNFKTTEEIKVPKKLIGHVIGQDRAVEIINKAAVQKRNVLLIGEPGTGKSLLGKAMAESMPHEKLSDILCFPNPKDENNPIIKTVPAGQGKNVVLKSTMQGLSNMQSKGWLYLIAFFVILNAIQFAGDFIAGRETSDVLAAADRIITALFLLVSMLILVIFYSLYKIKIEKTANVSKPKLLIDNSNKKQAPFEDATGIHAGALLGDIRHDPFQSGGLGTPAHERVEVGSIHRAHKGILFIDEISTLKPDMQIELLTAMQDKRSSITGKSDRSSGALVKTTPAPCDFVLIAAGNVHTIKQMHPALRSRMRGYGYEVFMNHTIEDNIENREKFAKFVAQEVKKDGKIPHFDRGAVLEILNEARRRSGRKGKLSLKLRDIGGVVRVAGDIALEKKSKIVTAKHVTAAKSKSTYIEQQIADRYIQEKKEYQVIRTSGSEVGRVNGLAVISKTQAGLILPIEANVTRAMSEKRGQIIATGKLGKIAQEAVSNVSAIIKGYSGANISNMDIHIQFLQAYEGVEGDSASVSVAAAVLSAIEGIKIKQDVAMTGSLSVRGEVLPVGGINSKIEAAAQAGVKKVIIPEMNAGDILPNKEIEKKVKIIPVKTIADVIKHSFDLKKSDMKILKKMKKSL